jgi:hypothetical protein
LPTGTNSTHAGRNEPESRAVAFGSCVAPVFFWPIPESLSLARRAQQREAARSRDLARWGLAHASDRLTSEDLNPGLHHPDRAAAQRTRAAGVRGALAARRSAAARRMWRMRKRVDISELPEHRVVIRFEFSGVPRSRMALHVMWLILERAGVDVCFKDPGYTVDLTVRSDLAVLVRLYLGHTNWQEVLAKP